MNPTPAKHPRSASLAGSAAGNVASGTEHLYEEDPGLVGPALPHLKTILVPTDFSLCSEKALTYAISIARRYGAKIYLVHVSQVQFYANEYAYLPIEDAAMCDAATSRLDKFAAGKINPELLAKTIVRNGVPFDEIVKTARELDTDIIVISTHGHAGLKHALIGSTAERVVRFAPCPVLVVREREHDFI
jgi:nucleotide-binding universal stress UspA family protein